MGGQSRFQVRRTGHAQTAEQIGRPAAEDRRHRETAAHRQVTPHALQRPPDLQRLPRLHEDGRVLIDGVDLSQIDIRAYREAIGIVMQEDQMFAGSIASNISFFDADGDQRRIEHAAKMAAIHDDIMKMPMRYQTLIGDMGATLSGGQKQRLLLARALYRQPSMLFLDEATSHLDMGNEKLVNRAIRSMALTRIIIAHRPETIAAADRVIRLEGGKVVDHVAHREMIEQLGR